MQSKDYQQIRILTWKYKFVQIFSLKNSYLKV